MFRTIGITLLALPSLVSASNDSVTGRQDRALTQDAIALPSIDALGVPTGSIFVRRMEFIESKSDKDCYWFQCQNTKCPMFKNNKPQKYGGVQKNPKVNEEGEIVWRCAYETCSASGYVPKGFVEEKERIRAEREASARNFVTEVSDFTQQRTRSKRGNYRNVIVPTAVIEGREQTARVEKLMAELSSVCSRSPEVCTMSLPLKVWDKLVDVDVPEGELIVVPPRAARAAKDRNELTKAIEQYKKEHTKRPMSVFKLRDELIKHSGNQFTSQTVPTIDQLRPIRINW